jgi:transcriptional regulator with XRE-family HTH domain
MRAVRYRRSLTQRQLAAACGFSKSTIADWERGVGEPTVGQLARVLAVAHLHLGLTDPPPEPAALTAADRVTWTRRLRGRVRDLVEVDDHPEWSALKELSRRGLGGSVTVFGPVAVGLWGGRLGADPGSQLVLCADPATGVLSKRVLDEHGVTWVPPYAVGASSYAGIRAAARAVQWEHQPMGEGALLHVADLVDLVRHADVRRDPDYQAWTQALLRFRAAGRRRPRRTAT